MSEMEEILENKVFWTKEKFKEKDQDNGDENSISEGDSDSIKEKTSDVRIADDDLNPPKIQEEVDALKAIENKVIGLYFAAGWCIPCQEFTSLLKQTYNELKERGSPFEVIFISFDKKFEDMKFYFTEKHGNWLAVPHRDSLVDALKTKYDIKAIPKLIVIRENGTVITEKGRKDIQDKGMICFRGWQQKANLSAPKPKGPDAPVTNTEQEKEKTVSFNENVKIE